MPILFFYLICLLLSYVRSANIQVSYFITPYCGIIDTTQGSYNYPATTETTNGLTTTFTNCVPANNGLWIEANCTSDGEYFLNVYSDSVCNNTLGLFSLIGLPQDECYSESSMCCLQPGMQNITTHKAPTIGGIPGVMVVCNNDFTVVSFSYITLFCLFVLHVVIYI